MLNFRQYIEASITDPRGEEVQFAPKYPSSAYEVVVIDMKKMLPYWQSNKTRYVEPGSPNEIGGRIQGFDTWYTGNEPYHRQKKAVETPRVNFEFNKELRDKYPDNPDVWKVDFSDGRHRFAWMVQQGFEKVPIEVPKADAEEFRTRFS